MMSDKDQIKMMLETGQADFVIQSGKEHFLLKGDKRSFIHEKTFWSAFEVLERSHKQGSVTYYKLKQEPEPEEE